VHREVHLRSSASRPSRSHLDRAHAAAIQGPDSLLADNDRSRALHEQRELAGMVFYIREASDMEIVLKVIVVLTG
jgi:hypothetical protein